MRTEDVSRACFVSLVVGLHFARICKRLAAMTDHSRTLTSLEAPGNAGMMMPVRAVACCRMCA